jgi:hypothetical protein
MVIRLDQPATKRRMYTAIPRMVGKVPKLITSNKSLGELAAIAGEEANDVYHSRLITVPCLDDGSLFENLHGYPTTEAFLEKHRLLTKQHFGKASRAFLQKLVAERIEDEAALKAKITRKIKFYLRAAKDLVVEGRSLDRIHQRMAITYAAGSLAIDYGVFPWKSLISGMH